MTQEAIQVVGQFITGFTKQEAEQIIPTLAPHFAIVGDDPSGDSPQLQAHMFLTGQATIDWVHGMLEEASPHENTFEVIHSNERMGAIVVVTEETGKNRFRSWDKQHATYILGDIAGEWKILAYYLQGH